MAKVVVTLEDTVDPVGVISSIDWGEKAEDPTPAQIMLVVAMDAWSELLKEEEE